MIACTNPSCSCSSNEYANNDAILANLHITENSEQIISTDRLIPTVLELYPIVVSTVVADPINHSEAPNYEHQQETLYVKFGGTTIAVDMNIPLIRNTNDAGQYDKIIGRYR